MLSLHRSILTTDPTPVSIDIKTNHYSPQIHQQRIFESRVFQNYQNQLVVFARKTLQELGLEFSPRLEEPEPKTYFSIFQDLIHEIISDSRLDYPSKLYYHQSVMYSLRLLCVKKKREEYQNSMEKNYQFTATLCHWMYAKVDLSQVIDSFFESSPSLNISTKELGCAQSMRNLFFEIIKDKQFSDSGREEVDFLDGHYSGQIPYRVFTLQPSNTTVLYNGSIVSESGLSEPGKHQIKLVPEFREFLDVLKDNNQNFLSVVLMNRRLQEEIKPTQVFELLDNCIENFIVIILDKLSMFYNQTDRSNPMRMRLKNFKDKFLIHLFSSFFYWSKKLDKKELKKICSNLISKVYDEYFQNQEYLTIEERKIIIDLVYVRLIEELCVIKKIDYCGVSCRMIADRTGSMLSLLYINQALKTKAGLEEDEQKKAIHLQFSPSLLSYNRTPNSEYLKRNILTIDFLENRAAEKIVEKI